jgi:hypothetical protein
LFPHTSQYPQKFEQKAQAPQWATVDLPNELHPLKGDLAVRKCRLVKGAHDVGNKVHTSVGCLFGMAILNSGADHTMSKKI